MILSFIITNKSGNARKISWLPKTQYFEIDQSREVAEIALNSSKGKQVFREMAKEIKKGTVEITVLTSLPTVSKREDVSLNSGSKSIKEDSKDFYMKQQEKLKQISNKKQEARGMRGETIKEAGYYTDPSKVKKEDSKPSKTKEILKTEAVSPKVKKDTLKAKKDTLKAKGEESKVSKESKKSKQKTSTVPKKTSASRKNSQKQNKE